MVCMAMVLCASGAFRGELAGALAIAAIVIAYKLYGTIEIIREQVSLQTSKCEEVSASTAKVAHTIATWKREWTCRIVMNSTRAKRAADDKRATDEMV